LSAVGDHVSRSAFQMHTANNVHMLMTL
jgi:hypothetical protein